MHIAEMRASSREAVFTALRSQGIRPGWVKESPGLFNKLMGYFARLTTVIISTVLITSAIVLVLLLRKELPNLNTQKSNIESRGQIYGDPSVLQKCELEMWRINMPCEGDQILSMFAQPGDDRAFIIARVQKAEPLRLCLDKDVVVLDSDLPEIAKMKRIVNWLKEELRTYIAAGGSVEGYLERLYDRQMTEIKIFEARKRALEKIKSEVATSPTADVTEAIRRWEHINGELRNLGLRTVEVPQFFFDKL